MKFINSYRFKIFLSLWVFGIVLVVIYQLSGHFIALMVRHNNEVRDFEIKKEITHIFDHFEQYNQASYPNSRFYKSYLGSASLPRHLRHKIENLEIGYHYLDADNGSGGNQSYYVAVFKQPASPDRFYILYDYTLYADEYIDYQIYRASRRFLLALVIVGVFGVFIGLFVSKKLIAPLDNLVTQVKDVDPEQLPTDFSQNFKNDELGVLANSLEKSMQRIKSFIEREKNFTRDSSHELRTPVTIIKGAVELIRQLPEIKNNALAKPVNRIERSANNMEEIIEAFLWLARERQVNINEESCLVGDVVTNAIEENRYLIAAKPISVAMKIDANPRVSVPEKIFRIAVVNLIRNAFLHTSQGQITINVRSKYLKITNSGTEIPADQLRKIKEPFQRGDNSKGVGIGLAIVERLCKKFDFSLDIDSDAQSNTRVKLSLEA